MFGIGCSFSKHHETGICVNKQQVEDQLKANKTIHYHFDENNTKDNKKIKHCDDSGLGYV